METFNIDFRTGSLIEKHSNSKGVNVGNKITRQEKGLAYSARQSNSGQITYPAADMTALNFGTGNFSVVCAFKMGKFINIGSGSNAIFAKGTRDSNDTINFYYTSNQEITVRWGDGANSNDEIILDDFGSLYDSKWHLAILTFDGTTYKAFLDNVQETTTSTTTKTITSAQDFLVGRDGSTSRRCNSDVAYIRAYDHELTQQERNTLQEEFEHSFGLTETKRGFVYPKATDLSKETGLVAAYNFIPSAGGVLTDIAGTNNGTITGALATKDGLKFDGVKDYISISSPITFSSGSTIAMRANFNNMSALSYLIGDSSNTTWGIRYDGNGFLIYTGTAGTEISWTKVDSIVSFVLVRTSSTNYNLYINGSLIGSMSDVGTVDLPFDLISKRGDDAHFADIEFEDIKIYNYAFTSQQAQDYHNSFQQVKLRETFSDTGADGVSKIPRGWQ